MVVGDSLMKIVYPNISLKEEIEKNLSDFFIANTFGFMQGKGFGGYILKTTDITKKYVAEVLRNTYKCKSVYSIDTNFSAIVKNKISIDKYRKQKCTDNIFDNIIKPFNSLMKSGINNGGYERSFLFQYFYQKPEWKYGNDKAFVKAKGIAPVVCKKANISKGENVHSYNAYKYVRALLGITEKIEYIHELDDNDRPVKDKDKGKVIKDSITIKSTDGIERYASPICYRIIKNTVYIFALPINEKLYKSSFKFSSKIIGNSDEVCEIIHVPQKADFDIEEFLAKFIEHINTNENARTVAKFNTEKFKEVT
jgi:hypothetical protein